MKLKKSSAINNDNNGSAGMDCAVIIDPGTSFCPLYLLYVFLSS
jgi:hypothetical protein